MEILVYITDQKERVIAGSPLALYMEASKEREECLVSLGRALKADVIQLSNGDHVLVKPLSKV